jgi:REP element-mobilizing transposase RayT
MKPDTSGGRSSATPPNAVRRLERKKPAHFPTVEVGFRSIIVFLTVCTHRRKSLLANEEAARRLIAAWQAANFWRVGRYVIMPDHVHLFCAPNTFPPRPLKNWIAFWRNHVTRAWPQRNDPEFSSFFDGNVFDVDLGILPSKAERTLIQLQVFKRFPLCKLCELFQKGNLINSSVTNTQRTFAG